MNAPEDERTIKAQTEAIKKLREELTRFSVLEEAAEIVGRLADTCPTGGIDTKIIGIRMAQQALLIAAREAYSAEAPRDVERIDIREAFDEREEQLEKYDRKRNEW